MVKERKVHDKGGKETGKKEKSGKQGKRGTTLNCIFSDS